MYVLFYTVPVKCKISFISMQHEHLLGHFYTISSPLNHPSLLTFSSDAKSSYVVFISYSLSTLHALYKLQYFISN